MFCKCGERFVGMFCHGCGSKAVDKKPPQISTSRSVLPPHILNVIHERKRAIQNSQRYRDDVFRLQNPSATIGMRNLNLVSSDAAQDALNRLMERREKDINQKKGEKTVKVKVEDEVKKTDTSKRTIHVHLVTKKGEDIKPKIIQFSQAHKFIILQADESETSEEWVAMINSLIPGIDFSIVTHDSNGVLSQKTSGGYISEQLQKTGVEPPTATSTSSITSKVSASAMSPPKCPKAGTSTSTSGDEIVSMDPEFKDPYEVSSDDDFLEDPEIAFVLDSQSAVVKKEMQTPVLKRKLKDDLPDIQVTKRRTLESPNTKQRKDAPSSDTKNTKVKHRKQISTERYLEIIKSPGKHYIHIIMNDMATKLLVPVMLTLEDLHHVVCSQEGVPQSYELFDLDDQVLKEPILVTDVIIVKAQDTGTVTNYE
ncbi:unnamed protein product [Owenia fusiformis]|uniref:Uncharacterized protein n=1 Tax=Owenia fusiformis TaxID=6347 RepID=A0A8S4PFS4_OWEFU|nr:unnamed protein product [Owenia fusiformis]